MNRSKTEMNYNEN